MLAILRCRRSVELLRALGRCRTDLGGTGTGVHQVAVVLQRDVYHSVGYRMSLSNLNINSLSPGYLDVTCLSGRAWWCTVQGLCTSMKKAALDRIDSYTATGKGHACKMAERGMWGPNVGRGGLYCDLCDFRRDACHLQSQVSICDLQEQISNTRKMRADDRSCIVIFMRGMLHGYLNATAIGRTAEYGASRELKSAAGIRTVQLGISTLAISKDSPHLVVLRSALAWKVQGEDGGPHPCRFEVPSRLPDDGSRQCGAFQLQIRSSTGQRSGASSCFPKRLEHGISLCQLTMRPYGWVLGAKQPSRC